MDLEWRDAGGGLSPPWAVATAERERGREEDVGDEREWAL